MRCTPPPPPLQAIVGDLNEEVEKATLPIVHYACSTGGPARRRGSSFLDKDLLDAEASIDPLVNNAPPTPSGIDIN